MDGAGGIRLTAIMHPTTTGAAMTLRRNGGAPGLASLVAVTIASAFLAACSTSTSAGPPAASSDLTVAVSAIAPPFNASNQANGQLRITSNVFDPLIFRDPKTGRLSSGLATQWTTV